MRRAAGDAPEEALPIFGKPSSVVARRKCTVAEKVKLSGVPETMLQTVYARAKESGSRGAIHDAKAEEIERMMREMFEQFKREMREEEREQGRVKYAS